MTPFLPHLTEAYLFTLGLVFARVGAIFMFLPAFGDTIVPGRIKLSIALIFSIIVTPAILPMMHELPPTFIELVAGLAHEMMVGVFLGLCTRIFFLGLELIGTIYSQQLGLAAASILNPLLGQQVSPIGNFFLLAGATFLLATDLHQTLFAGIVHSYHMIPLEDQSWPLRDFFTALLELFVVSFNLAIRIAAPILILGTLLFLALGILNRLMPQMMIFFVAHPAQIAFGIVVLYLTVHIGISLFMSQYAQSLQSFLRG